MLQAVQHLLKDVRQIQSAGDAFAAIVGEGRIVARCRSGLAQPSEFRNSNDLQPNSER